MDVKARLTLAGRPGTAPQKEQINIPTVCYFSNTRW